MKNKTKLPEAGVTYNGALGLYIRKSELNEHVTFGNFIVKLTVI